MRLGIHAIMLIVEIVDLKAVDARSALRLTVQLSTVRPHPDQYAAKLDILLVRPAAEPRE
jgi:hypothetical protein